MNKTLATFARDSLKERLSKCTDGQKHIFKRMYSPNDLEADINLVVDRIPEDSLSWALTQVENTMKKFNKGKDDE